MGKGPTRRQGTGKASETVRAIHRGARDADPHTGTVRGGYHDSDAKYDRKDDNTRDLLAEYKEETNPHTRIKELEAALVAAQEEIKRLGQDCVSGLAVRATFEKHIEGVFNARRCEESPIGILMCDIDKFKDVNDNFGHRAGDEVISQVARCIREATRASDLVARYGGEEFVVVIANNCKVAGLAMLAERIRASVDVMVIEGLPHVTISIGFTAQHSRDTSGWDLVERADQNLYRAKDSGRNRVCHETLGSLELQLILDIEQLQDKPEEDKGD